MKVKCLTCGKKFHKKRIAMHVRAHLPQAPENQASQLTISDYERGRTQGYREGQKDESERLSQRQAVIGAIESCSKMVNAIASIVSEGFYAR
jgi:hypothetical protein